MSPPTCFIAMPLTTAEESRAKYHGDGDHFVHVLEHLFVPAVEAAGFSAVRPIMSGGDVIQGQIIKHLETADMVLCDISSHNPNVFFELGIRTALDRPVALVRDNHTEKLPFDTSIVNTHTYNSSLTPWTLRNDTQGITQHLADTWKSTPNNNDLWGFFGLTKRASERLPSENPLEAKMDLIMSQLSSLSVNAEPDLHTFDTDDLVDRLFTAANHAGLEVLGVTTQAKRGITVELANGSVPPEFKKEVSLLSKMSRKSIKVTGPGGVVLVDFPRF